MYRQLKLFLTKNGMQPDAGALGRFVRSGTGIGTSENKSLAEPGQKDFAKSEYEAPLEFSPTQRYEIGRKKKIRFRGLNVNQQRNRQTPEQGGKSANQFSQASQ